MIFLVLVLVLRLRQIRFKSLHRVGAFRGDGELNVHRGRVIEKRWTNGPKRPSLLWLWGASNR